MAYAKWGFHTKGRGKLLIRFFEYSNSKEFLPEPVVFEYELPWSESLCLNIE